MDEIGLIEDEPSRHTGCLLGELSPPMTPLVRLQR